MEAGVAFYNQTWNRFSQLLSEHLPPPPDSVLPNLSVEDHVSTTHVDSTELEHARCEVLRLFQKQEYFRQAYNDTLARMDALASILPSEVIPQLPGFSPSTSLIQTDAGDLVQEVGYQDNKIDYDMEFIEQCVDTDDGYEVRDEDEEPNDEDIELSPELIEFMMQTLKHREERDRVKNDREAAQRIVLHKAPPPKPSTASKPANKQSSVEAEIARLETALLHHYEYCSPSRDAPFWPFLSVHSL